MHQETKRMDVNGDKPRFGAVNPDKGKGEVGGETVGCHHNTYTTIQGDTWDLIAKKTLGSEYLMTELMNANKDKIKVRIFEGGEILLIPEKKTGAVTITPPWGNE